MASITREQFASSFQGRSIDVANLSPELRKDLAAAGITAAELKQIAGADGVIQGSDELGKLFKEIDNLDRDGAYRTLVTSDANGKATQAGELIADLRAEVEKSRLRTPVSTAKPSADKQDPTAAPWLDVARKEIGQKERKGTDVDNQRVIEYHSTVRGKFKHDETAWCSSFVNWVMQQSNQPRTGSALALSWKNYGTKADGPVLGSIAVIDRGGGHGHVGFVVGRDGDKVVLLGGNQKGEVRYSTYPANKISEYRLPPGYQPPAGPLPEMKLKDGKPLTYAEMQ